MALHFHQQCSKRFVRSFYLFGFRHQNFYSIFFNFNLSVWEKVNLIEALGLVFSTMGTQIYIPGLILTRVNFFYFAQLHFLCS